MRACYVVLTCVLGTGLITAQVADPHESTVIQNTPENKKDENKKQTGAAPGQLKQVPLQDPTAERQTESRTAGPSPVPADPEQIMLGEWNLVPARSTFQPGPPPKSETRRYERTNAGIVATIVRIGQDGSRTETSYPWVIDESEHQITGSDLVDRIQLRQIDNLTAEATLRHAGKTLATERRSISADGKSMTIVLTDRSSEEKPVTIRAVYEKSTP